MLYSVCLVLVLVGFPITLKIIYQNQHNLLGIVNTLWFSNNIQ